MHRWTVRAARVALVAAAISAAGAGVANADNTTGDHSVLGGAQIHIPIIAPIGLFGNRINVLSSGIGQYRLSGATMRQADPQPQLDICGNAISGNNGMGTAACKGDANAGGEESAAATIKPARVTPAHVTGTIGAGTAVVGAPGSPAAAMPSVASEPAPADDSDKSKTKEPADTSDSSKSKESADTSDKSKSKESTDTSDKSKTEMPSADSDKSKTEMPSADSDKSKTEMPAADSDKSKTEAPAADSAQAPAATSAAAPAQNAAAAPIRGMRTSGDNSVAGGNQVQAPVRMPIRICGNAGALGGTATASCEGSASSGRLSGAHRAFRALGAADLRG